MGTKLHKVALFLLLGWVLAAGLFLAWRESPTTDEGIHVASGYLALTRGETRFDPEHPFLFKYVSAFPLVLAHPHLPVDDQKLWEGAKPTLYDAWQEAREWTDEWLYTGGNNAQLLIFLARIPGVLAFLALCYLVYRLVREWFSPTVGLLALVFTAFNPTLLAHASLANTDVPIALAYFIVIWTLYRYWQKPGWATALWGGLAVGAALTTKFSGIAVLPVALLWLVFCVTDKKVGLRTVLLHTLANLVVILAFIWTVYLWRSPVDLESVRQGFAVSHYQLLRDLALHLHLLIPTSFAKGLALTLGSTTGGRRTVLLNRLYSNGVWYYFPVVFFLKTQLVALLLLFYGFVTSLPLLRRPGKWRAISVLLTYGSTFYLILALVNKLDIGIRHISVLMPFVAIFLAIALERFTSRFSGRAWWVGGAVLLYIVPVLVQADNPLGFSNLIVHPKDAAYTFFSDSNLDWGQESQDLVRAANTHFAGQDFYLDYEWSPYATGYYGLKSHLYDPAILPSQGIIIVTASQLALDERYFKFRAVKPALTVRHVVFFYRAQDLIPHH